MNSTPFKAKNFERYPHACSECGASAGLPCRRDCAEQTLEVEVTSEREPIEAFEEAWKEST